VQRILSGIVLLLLLTGFRFNATPPAGAPSTTNNDDSCDIGVAPAATLLLPYFEIDLDSPVDSARTTLFTITNVGGAPQIARVTLWSDWAFPVLTFNVFLTGYDVQSINLHDVIADGAIVPTSIGAAAGNPNFLSGAATHCGAKAMPRTVPAALLADVRSALTTGTTSLCGSARVGAAHERAIGYATVDVVADCTFMLPSDEGFQQRELTSSSATTRSSIRLTTPRRGMRWCMCVRYPRVALLARRPARTSPSRFTTASRRRRRADSIAASRCLRSSRHATSRAGPPAFIRTFRSGGKG
jgi:hypothetical protein